MPSLNIQQLLSSLAQQQQSPHPQQSGVDPNIALIMQAMGMMPKQLDMQGRPIIPGQQNPSLMDQHYARQANPQAMQERYSAPTFAMGPARVDNGNAPIVAHQPVSGLPGQVGPAYSTQMTPIAMAPTPDEIASMQKYRDATKPTQQVSAPWRPTSSSAYVPQGPPTPAMPAWQGPPVPTTQQEAQNINREAVSQWDAGVRPPVPVPTIAVMPDLSGQIRSDTGKSLPMGAPNVLQMLQRKGAAFQQKFPLINRLSR